MVWIDLANAYSSVRHKLIDFVIEFFHVPECVRTIITKYFSNLHMCFALDNYTLGWQQLEYGIAMGCAISPILFVTAFEIILRGARQVVGGIKLPSGERLPPLRSHMDNVMSILQTSPCMARLLNCLDELITWARRKKKKDQACKVDKPLNKERSAASQDNICHWRRAHPTAGRTTTLKPGEAVHRRPVRQTDGEASQGTSHGGPGQD